jgi:hypothetical protein
VKALHRRNQSHPKANYVPYNTMEDQELLILVDRAKALNAWEEYFDDFVKGVKSEISKKFLRDRIATANALATAIFFA